MPSNYSSAQSSRAMRRMRWLVGLLLVANLIAAGLVMFPPGGSAETLEQDWGTLQTRVAAQRKQNNEMRTRVASIQKGRAEGDQFLSNYFLERRTAYTTLLSELVTAASQAGIQAREHAYSLEPIEGSDTLTRMIITANYEGSYANLLRFIHAIDRSQRLLIIEALTAAPQQGEATLNINLKMDAFLREDAALPASAASNIVAQGAAAQ